MLYYYQIDRHRQGETMKDKIHICKANRDGSLTILDTKTLKEDLDADTLTIFVKYQGKRFDVQGGAFSPYIVIEQEKGA